MQAYGEATLIEAMKINLLAHGVHIEPSAEAELTNGGNVPLSVHEYTTTGGVTLILDSDVYINAPFDEPTVQAPEAILRFDASSGGYVLGFRDREFSVRCLPLPGYLGQVDSHGRPLTDSVFSHADRARLSPLYGCAFTCKFCDFPGKPYGMRPIEQLLEALQIAKADSVLPAHHLLISGGTPSKRDYGYFDDVCAAVVQVAGMPVDVMMPPRPEDPGFVDRLVDLGVHGFAINIEIFSDEASRYITPQKYRRGVAGYAAMIERAVERTGGQGRVRSLILVGLEPAEETLKGVEFLARLGCDPCLSPFRPSAGTALEHAPAPSTELLERVYFESRDIAERFGVKLGPRCIPCQHNTLTLPDASGAYYFSSDRS